MGGGKTPGMAATQRHARAMRALDHKVITECADELTLILRAFHGYHSGVASA